MSLRSISFKATGTDPDIGQYVNEARGIGAEVDVGDEMLRAYRYERLCMLC